MSNVKPLVSALFDLLTAVKTTLLHCFLSNRDELRVAVIVDDRNDAGISGRLSDLFAAAEVGAA